MAVRIQSYKPLKSAGSVKAFYDDIVYWEMAKNNNKFYVTFMKGEYALPNNKQESIGTMEIGFPHTSLGNEYSVKFTTSYKEFNNTEINGGVIVSQIFDNLTNSSVKTYNDSPNYTGDINNFRYINLF